jgi:hypothetical protein
MGGGRWLPRTRWPGQQQPQLVREDLSTGPSSSRTWRGSCAPCIWTLAHGLRQRSARSTLCASRLLALVDSDHSKWNAQAQEGLSRRRFGDRRLHHARIRSLSGPGSSRFSSIPQTATLCTDAGVAPLYPVATAISRINRHSLHWSSRSESSGVFSTASFRWSNFSATSAPSFLRIRQLTRPRL